MAEEIKTEGTEAVQETVKETAPEVAGSPSTTEEVALPDNKEEAAKAFQEMRHQIKELEGKVAAQPAETSAMDKLSEATVTLDENTEVGELAKQALTEARKANVRAELGGIFSKYPTLNPESGNFDKNFETLVAARYALSDRLQEGRA